MVDTSLTPVPFFYSPALASGQFAFINRFISRLDLDLGRPITFAMVDYSHSILEGFFCFFLGFHRALEASHYYLPLFIKRRHWLIEWLIGF